jgi:carboxypeptidase D
VIIEEMFAGFMPLDLDPENNREGSYFFWLVKRRPQVIKTPEKLVVWLNGGPGCSSMVGMMWENGPFNIEEGGDSGLKYKLVRNPSAWNEEAHMLFVEQPIRTGFSTAAKHTHRIRSEKDVAKDFYLFMQSFLKIFSDFRNVAFYITGESYAGSYIPWMADYILRLQLEPRSLPKGSVMINLCGVAIGNGMIDFVAQEASYAEYAYQHGLIPKAARIYFETMYAQCLQSIEAGYTIDRSAFGRCNLMGMVLDAAGRPNEYNINTFTQYDYIGKPDGIFHTFLNDPVIQAILHVRGFDVPGINFVPGHKDGFVDSHGGVVGANNGSGTWFEPDVWQVCNDNIVRKAYIITICLALSL